MDFLLNGKWNVQTDITQNTFIAKHRYSFHSLQQGWDHVTVEILSEHPRVGHLLDNIEFNDKDVSEALSSVCLDDNMNGTRNEYERVVSFILPTDPVNNKNNRGHAHIYYVSTSSTASKSKGR